MHRLIEWKFTRHPRKLTEDEFMARLEAAPEKIEWKGGIFVYDRERITVLAMLIEVLGIDRVVSLGNIEDWKAAIAAREEREAKRG